MAQMHALRKRQKVAKLELVKAIKKSKDRA